MDRSDRTESSPVAEPAGADDLANGPAIDFTADEWDEKPEQVSDSQPSEPESPAETETPESEPEETSIEYGSRNRVRRPQSDRAEGDQVSEELSPVPDTKDGFSVEEQSFGRSKRKRTR
jgi:hypothetical protein